MAQQGEGMMMMMTMVTRMEQTENAAKEWRDTMSVILAFRLQQIGKGGQLGCLLQQMLVVETHAFQQCLHSGQEVCTDHLQSS